MTAPTRRGLISLFLAAVAWLVGRRADASPATAASGTETPTAPATPAVLAAGPPDATFSSTSSDVVTFVYDPGVRALDRPATDVVTYTYDGGGWRHA